MAQENYIAVQRGEKRHLIVNITQASSDVHKVEVDDRIVGFALRMADGCWRAYRPDMETRVERVSHKTPMAAARVLIQEAMP